MKKRKLRKNKKNPPSQKKNSGNIEKSSVTVVLKLGHLVKNHLQCFIKKHSSFNSLKYSELKNSVFKDKNCNF